jgi:hypothetical protein
VYGEDDEYVPLLCSLHGINLVGENSVPTRKVARRPKSSLRKNDFNALLFERGDSTHSWIKVVVKRQV